jgi:hypothetical protein
LVEVTSILKATSMNSRQILKRAVFVAGMLLICSLIAYKLLDPNPSAGYVTLPGFLVGIFVATIVAAARGNAHNIDLATILIVASLINFFCYLGFTYMALMLWSRGRKK